jgi:hypothetical protein
VQSVADERRALAEQLGPERVAALRQETHDHARQRLARLRDTAAWQNRVHSRLSDTELGRAIRHAERQRAEHLAAADRARTRYAEQEPAVAAGRGPRVTELGEQLDRHRSNAEHQTTVEQIEHRWHAAVTQAGDAAARAAISEFDAERTRWWQTGRHQQLQAQAAADRALADQATAKADELAKHAAQLKHQLGGPGHWQLARERAHRAEHTYDRARDIAHKADQAELTRLRDRAAGHDTAAADARTRHTELLAEHHLRTTMPAEQLALEHQLRAQAAEQQPLDHTTSAHQLDRTVHPDLHPEFSHEVHRHIEQDINRDAGPGL